MVFTTIENRKIFIIISVNSKSLWIFHINCYIVYNQHVFDHNSFDKWALLPITVDHNTNYEYKFNLKKLHKSCSLKWIPIKRETNYQHQSKNIHSIWQEYS